jgi:hypothetical protein
MSLKQTIHNVMEKSSNLERAKKVKLEEAVGKNKY